MARFADTPDADDVGRAITLFLERMTSDHLLAWAFDGVDLERLHKHARAFVIAALGGPDLYTGRDLRTAHIGLELRDEHFDAAVDHLITSLGAVGITDSLTAALASRLEPLRDQIVSV
jgi:hemoglobin